jgi:hypothetical protein
MKKSRDSVTSPVFRPQLMNFVASRQIFLFPKKRPKATFKNISFTIRCGLLVCGKSTNELLNGNLRENREKKHIIALG